VDFRSQCEAQATKGFQFSSWTENLGGNSSTIINPSKVSNVPLSTLLSALGILSKDASANLTVTKFGNFTANFERVPPPIPPEYWIQLYGIIVSSIVGWSVPSIIGWLKARRQGGRADQYYKRIDRLYSDGKLDENDIEPLDSLKRDLTFAFAKRKISEQHYNELNRTISVLYEEIYKKKIDSLNGKHGNGILLDKVKDGITDAFAKRKLTEQHYKLLNEKISDSKNSQQSNNNQLASSSQSSVPTATTQGSPIKI
jgi:hypothetical protein